MAYIWLTCLEMVYKRIHSKKYRLVEQSLCKLKVKEVEVAKISSIPTEVETADILVIEFLFLVIYLLLSTDPFLFNFSFF